MGAVIGELLPFALGIAISPVPIIVVILTLLSARARSSSLGFLFGWVIGIVGVIVALTLLSSLLPTRSDHTPTTWQGVLKLVLGALLLILAVKQWQKRPSINETPTLPTWMQKVDSFGFLQGLQFGLMLSVLNPKNIILSMSVATDLRTAALPIDQLITVIVVFTALAASSVLIPVIVYLVASTRLHGPLEALHLWLARENHVIMAVLLLVLGVSTLGKGIGIIWP